MIESKANVNEDNEIISTPLLVAAEKGHTEIVKYLIESEANVNACDEMGAPHFWWQLRKDILKLSNIS